MAMGARLRRGGPERGKADLHLHSTCSDGLWEPARVVSEAKRCGVEAMALTDHDTCEGLPAASCAAADLGLAFLPGVEISVTHPAAGELHVLGYGMDRGWPGTRSA